MYILLRVFSVISFLVCAPTACKNYVFNKEPIDVVMPCHEKDIETLDLCIDSVKKYVKNLNRVIIVSEKKLTNNAEWFDEAKFPFSKESIALEIFNGDKQKAFQFLTHPKTRIGWIFKQILNLYSFFVIPNLSSNVLAIDTDTILLKPIEFLDDNGAGLYNPGTEYHYPYFVHAAKLIPGFKKVFQNYSGISHHLLFQRSVMEDLHTVVFNYHNTELWRAICKCIDHNELFGSCIAEYEIYFNFLFSNTNQVKIRHLKWANHNNLNIDYFRKHEFDYVSCHKYLRD